MRWGPVYSYSDRFSEKQKNLKSGNSEERTGTRLGIRQTEKWS